MAPLWLVTHVDLHRTAKVQTFLKHIKEYAGQVSPSVTEPRPGAILPCWAFPVSWPARSRWAGWRRPRSTPRIERYRASSSRPACSGRSRRATAG